MIVPRCAVSDLCESRTSGVGAGTSSVGAGSAAVVAESDMAAGSDMTAGSDMAVGAESNTADTTVGAESSTANTTVDTTVGAESSTANTTVDTSVGAETKTDIAVCPRVDLRPRTVQGRQWPFNEAWKRNGPWLRYSGTTSLNGTMTCTVCVKQKAPGGWKNVWADADAGCKTLRESEVKKHETDERHVECMQRSTARSSASTPSVDGDVSAVRTAVARAAETDDENRPFYALFINAHTLARENIPNRSFSELCDADRMKGTPILERYCTNHAAADMQASISDVIFEEQLERLKQSPRVGFAVDESTDVSHTKQMVVYVFYVDEAFEMRVEFWKMVECPDGTANGIFATVKHHVRQQKDSNGAAWLWDKWVSFGSDGPTVMTGASLLFTRNDHSL